MRFFSSLATYKAPWEEVTAAFWRKYPNPHSRHVLSTDLLDRRVDEAEGKMYSTRLLLKTKKVPAVAQRFVSGGKAWVIEKSVVDSKAKTMETTTQNLTYKNVLSVCETVTYRPHPDNPRQWTETETRAKIVSSISVFHPIVESFGLERFKTQYEQTKVGLQYVIDLMKDEKNNLMHTASAHARNVRDNFANKYATHEV
eukprot:Clim_evm30s241 gene=Clim_evmTU30s241